MSFDRYLCFQSILLGWRFQQSQLNMQYFYYGCIMEKLNRSININWHITRIASPSKKILAEASVHVHYISYDSSVELLPIQYILAFELKGYNHNWPKIAWLAWLVICIWLNWLSTVLEYESNNFKQSYSVGISWYIILLSRALYFFPYIYWGPPQHLKSSILIEELMNFIKLVLVRLTDDNRTSHACLSFLYPFHNFIFLP